MMERGNADKQSLAVGLRELCGVAGDFTRQVDDLQMMGG